MSTGDVPFQAADVGTVAAAALLLGLSAVAAVLAARRLPHINATG